MARPTKKISLSEAQLTELSEDYKSKHSKLSRKAHAVLLKHQQMKSKEIAILLSANENTVNKWITNYLSEGLSGFEIKLGRGRKSIPDESDAVKVRAAVAKERQRLKYVKEELEEELEQELNKELSMKTLKRFLKNLTASLNDCV